MADERRVTSDERRFERCRLTSWKRRARTRKKNDVSKRKGTVGGGRAAANRKSALSRSLYAHPKSPTRNAATLSLPNRLAFALQNRPLFFIALPPFFPSDGPSAKPNPPQNGKAQTTPTQPRTRPLAPRISQPPRPSCRHLLKSQLPHPFPLPLSSLCIHPPLSTPPNQPTSSINSCIASCRVINQTPRKHHFPSSQWPAPSRPPVSPPVARLPASSSPPRLPASPRPPPEVSRSLTATSLVPSLCVRSVATRRAPSC